MGSEGRKKMRRRQREVRKYQGSRPCSLHICTNSHCDGVQKHKSIQDGIARFARHLLHIWQSLFNTSNLDTCFIPFLITC